MTSPGTEGPHIAQEGGATSALAAPSWSTPRGALRLFMTGQTVRTATPVALFVGTVLSAVNQGSVLVAGTASATTWVRVCVNYLVPFCVASYGYLMARRLPHR